MPLVYKYLLHQINEISGLTSNDYIRIVATYNLALNGPSIDPEIYTKGYSPEVIKVLEATAEKDFSAVKSQNLIFEIPLENFPYESFSYILTLHTQYELGNLPFPGAVSEQPAQIIEIMGLITSLKREAEQKKKR